MFSSKRPAKQNKTPNKEQKRVAPKPPPSSHRWSHIEERRRCSFNVIDTRVYLAEDPMCSKCLSVRRFGRGGHYVPMLNADGLAPCEV